MTNIAEILNTVITAIVETFGTVLDTVAGSVK
jgi:diacylglycerol kinase